jgi:pimeloyl-ACP methyl ester carboxylesterase
LSRFATYQAGLTKCSLPIENDDSTAFSYCEKGLKTDEKPSIVFVHGLSSNKETWLPIIKVRNQVYAVLVFS